MLYRNILNKKKENEMVKNKTKARNNLDIAMLITDAILNEFEKNGKLDVPLDEHKYSFDLQDRIQIELEKIANEDMIEDNTKSIGE
jgi:hypothetical protein